MQTFKTGDYLYEWTIIGNPLLMPERPIAQNTRLVSNMIWKILNTLWQTPNIHNLGTSFPQVSLSRESSSAGEWCAVNLQNPVYIGLKECISPFHTKYVIRPWRLWKNIKIWLEKFDEEYRPLEIHTNRVIEKGVDLGLLRELSYGEYIEEQIKDCDTFIESRWVKDLKRQFEEYRDCLEDFRWLSDIIFKVQWGKDIIEKRWLFFVMSSKDWGQRKKKKEQEKRSPVFGDFWGLVPRLGSRL